MVKVFEIPFPTAFNQISYFKTCWSPEITIFGILWKTRECM